MGTGQGEAKRPPNDDELTTTQHPNSKSGLGGSKSYAGGTLSGIRSASELRYRPSMRTIKSDCRVL